MNFFIKTDHILKLLVFYSKTFTTPTVVHKKLKRKGLRFSVIKHSMHFISRVGFNLHVYGSHKQVHFAYIANDIHVHVPDIFESCQ